MMTVTMAQIAAITAGRLSNVEPDRQVHGKLEFDSRRIEPGDLFLAIPGEHVDGAHFAERAVDAGALAVMTTREALARADGSPLPSITVADPVGALTELARAAAGRLAALIIGVTGSAGKTTTKDLISQILAEHGRTVAPPGSFNNELGHPYTVLMADERTEYLVLEKSARGIGHIAHLTRIARPRIGTVLNVGSAHLGEFGSVEAIAQAKGELVEALPPAAEGGIAVLNADDPRVMQMASRTQAEVVTFGQSRAADVRAEGIELDAEARPSFDLCYRGLRAGVALRLHGGHQVANALAAAATTLAAGLQLSDVAAALNVATSRSHWRMEVSQNAREVTVINDAYNANPESMRAALKALAAMAQGRRSVAVLGHMAELGDRAVTEHEGIGRLIVRLDITKLIAVGELARPIAQAAALEGSGNSESEWVPDVAAAITRLAEFTEPGDVVLVKGSRSAGMQRVAAALLSDHAVVAAE